eukprot:RCo042124
MEEVAEMNLDVITQKRSPFKEIADIQAFFGTMVSKLMEFRAYLPEAVLCSAEDGKSNVPDPQPQPQPRPMQQQRGSSPSCNSARVAPAPGSSRDSLGSQEDLTARRTHPTHPVGEESLSPKVAHLSERRGSIALRHVGILTHRTVSALQMDVVGFHNLFQDEAALISTHSAVIQATGQIIHFNGGLSMPFAGDKVLAFWNVR